MKDDDIKAEEGGEYHFHDEDDNGDYILEPSTTPHQPPPSPNKTSTLISLAILSVIVYGALKWTGVIGGSEKTTEAPKVAAKQKAVQDTSKVSKDFEKSIKTADKELAVEKKLLAQAEKKPKAPSTKKAAPAKPTPTTAAAKPVPKQPVVATTPATLASHAQPVAASFIAPLPKLTTIKPMMPRTDSISPTEAVIPYALSSAEAKNTTAAKLTQLSIETSANHKQLENTQKHLRTLEVSVDHANEHLGKVTNNLNGVAHKIDAMHGGLSKLESHFETLSKVVKEYVAPPADANTAQGYQSPSIAAQQPRLKALYIQAIIPGRAWLKNVNGRIISVGRGDLIPGYGRVRSVDANSGVVYTTSGKTIEFGIENG